MDNADEPVGEYLHQIDFHREENAEDIELAYRVQNSSQGNVELLGQLIGRYAGDLYRWVSVLLYYQRGTTPPDDEIKRRLQYVFTFAILHLDQFHGQASLNDWLFAISYQLTRRSFLSDWISWHLLEIKKNRTTARGQGEISWASLAYIPGNQRIPMFLKYLFNLELNDIAVVLNLPVEQVHKHLAAGRRHFLGDLADRKMTAVLQAYIDGLYHDDPEKLRQVVEHLETCSECQAYMRRVNKAEKSLATSLSSQWPQKSLSPSECDELAELVSLRIQLRDKDRQLKFNLNQAAWVLGLLGLFAVLAVVFIRLTPVEKEFPQLQVSATAEIPPITNMESVQAATKGNSTISHIPQYIDPAISSDGKWAVFSSINTDMTTMELTIPTVSLYNHQDNTIQVISESSGALRSPWVWWDLAPSISADGQRVVYVSIANNPEIGGYPCNTHAHFACLDVYLYDQGTKLTTRITQAVYGGAADGDSLAPTISADGNWIAFWSAADNLGDVNRDNCQQSGTSITCLYIYLYNIQTQAFEQIPIRNKPGDEVFGVDRISLSADGRFVGFTVLQSAQAITLTDNSAPVVRSILGVNQASEAVIYDRLTRSIELVNRAVDGTAGNGPSSSPVLSADGRYVAFVSVASNLVPGDNNSASDVFVRDRQTGAIQLVSISSDKSQGNNDSGVILLERGFFSIDMSSDARYIVFQSRASNLQNLSTSDCSQVFGFCYYLFVHDRQTGTTSLLTDVASQGFSFFPEISADGRWVSYTQYVYNCTPQQFTCSNMILNDRQRGWEYDLTNFTQPSYNLPWTYSATLDLPWESWESRGLAFSPDGKILAIGGYDSRIRMWYIPDDLSTISRSNPDVTLESSGNDTFSALAFSQDNHWLAAGTVTGVVYIWDVTQGNLLFTLVDQATPISCLVFSRDGSRLIISTQNKLRIYTIGAGKVNKEAVISFGDTAVYSVDISPQGDLVATGRGDGTVWLQNLTNGKLVARLGGLNLAVYSLAFSNDGSLLAARSSEGKINLWKIVQNAAGVPTLTLLNTIQSYETNGELIFSPDNKYLASTGTNGHISMWSVPAGEIYRLIPLVPTGIVFDLAFSKAGDRLAAVFENKIDLWGISPESTNVYFTHASEDKYVNSPPLPLSAADNISGQYDDNLSGMISLAQAYSSSKFPLITPNHLPETLVFLGATVNPDGSVWLRYINYASHSDNIMLYIYERAMGSAPQPMTVGASAAIKQVMITNESGRMSGEYVQGDWSLVLGFIPPADNATAAEIKNTWQWDNASASQRLRWQQAGVYVALYYQVSSLVSVLSGTVQTNPLISSPGQVSAPAPLSTLLSEDDILQIASGMGFYKP